MVSPIAESQSLVDRSPGAGTPGVIKPSNFNTRLVYVRPHLSNGNLQDDDNVRSLVTDRGPMVSRRIVKGITTTPYQIGSTLGETGLEVESSLPFESHGGDALYWTVAANNNHGRLPDPQLAARQRQFIQHVAKSPKYQPQPASSLLEFARQHNGDFHIIRITPDRFPIFRENLRSLYDEALPDYPYDVVGAIGETCGDNLFLAAVLDDTVLSITGVEFLNPIDGIQVGEVGDSASRLNATGLAALLKRALIQTLYEQGRLPHILFTDSRIGKVLEANRRAGFILDPAIILRYHTHIASPNRDPGEALIIAGVDQEQQTVYFPVENMTMTYVDRIRAETLLKEFGTIQI